MTVPQTVPGRRADTDVTPDEVTETIEAAAELSAEDLDAQSPAADLVRVYLNGIGKTALLTAAQEVDLAKRIEAGVFAKHVLDSADGRRHKRFLPPRWWSLSPLDGLVTPTTSPGCRGVGKRRRMGRA